eukprot:403352823
MSIPKSQKKVEIRSPLLINSKSNSPDAEHGLKSPEIQKRPELTKAGVLSQIINMSICPIITMILHPAYQAVNLIITGKHPQNALNLQAAIGLSTLFMNTLILTIQVGFNGSLGTLVSQAYGQKDYRLCGLYLNRQLILNAIIFIPMAIMAVFSKYIYIAIGQDSNMAQDAASFLQIALPGFFCFGQFQCYQRYLAAQREVRFSMYINIIAFILHIPICYYLTLILDLGIQGIAIAVTLHFFIRFALIIIFVRFSRFYENIVPLQDPDTFWNLKMQLKMSAINSLMFIAGQWALDSFTLMSTFMSVTVIAAQTVCRSIILIVYMVPVGLSQASSIFVGNMIGQKRVKDAQLTTPDIIELVSQIYRVLSFYVLFDAMAGMGNGLIIGIGRQAKASIFTIMSFWIIGVPLSAILAFSFDMQLQGLWLGSLVGVIICAISYYTLLTVTDWHQRIREAISRRQSEKKLLPVNAK